MAVAHTHDVAAILRRDNFAVSSIGLQHFCLLKICDGDFDRGTTGAKSLKPIREWIRHGGLSVLFVASKIGFRATATIAIDDKVPVDGLGNSGDTVILTAIDVGICHAVLLLCKKMAVNNLALFTAYDTPELV